MQSRVTEPATERQVSTVVVRSEAHLFELSFQFRPSLVYINKPLCVSVFSAITGCTS